MAFEKVYKTDSESCFMSTRGLSDAYRTPSVRMLSVLDHMDEKPTSLDLKDVCELDGFSHKALFETELGQLALYNYCMGMSIHVINVRMATAYQASIDNRGHKATTRAYMVHPQDENDFQNSVYMGVFENLTPEKCGRELSMKEFSMLVADVAYLFHDKYAYRHNRTGMDVSMDGYGTTEDGARVNLLSYDYLTEKRVNAQIENALKNEKAMKNADEIFKTYKTSLESVFNKQDLKDFERLYKMRADSQVMTSQARNRLNYLIRTARARHQVITGQAHDYTVALKLNNRAMKKLATEKAKAEKAMKKLATRKARYETRCKLFLKAINALLMTTPSDNPNQPVLFALWAKVNAYQPTDDQDDRALKPFRAEFKSLKMAIKGHSLELQGIKQATKKALKKVSV